MSPDPLSMALACGSKRKQKTGQVKARKPSGLCFHSQVVLKKAAQSPVGVRLSGKAGPWQPSPGGKFGVVRSCFSALARLSSGSVLTGVSRVGAAEVASSALAWGDELGEGQVCPTLSCSAGRRERLPG